MRCVIVSVMGLITCDVTGMGVVVTVDSQPTTIQEGRVETVLAPLDRPRLVPRVAGGFSGVGYRLDATS